jgi:hypothetical protein
MSDIKDLLGKAIGDDEPPLGIDRDEVFRAGRQRVRRRRTIAAGGVVAAVVVAAVGAATLTNFVSLDPEPVPPAVGDSEHAPPGPDLPLTSTTHRPPDGPDGPPLTAAHADELTSRLYGSFTPATVIGSPGQTGRPGFRVEDDVYLYESDIADGKGEGVLQVTVGAATPGTEATCADVGEYDTCKEKLTDGEHIAQATWKGPDGERRNIAVAVLPDGTKVAAMASNFSRRHEDAGKRPAGDDPVLDLEKLSQLIVKSGFRVR